MIRSLGDKTPRIAESAFVSEAAYVVGHVEMGENSSVWPGAGVPSGSSSETRMPPAAEVAKLISSCLPMNVSGLVTIWASS